jgi:hypothetical protein
VLYDILMQIVRATCVKNTPKSRAILCQYLATRRELWLAAIYVL